eukprot:1139263-Pelagomonas_calceolata.AAC.7
MGFAQMLSLICLLMNRNWDAKIKKHEMLKMIRLLRNRDWDVLFQSLVVLTLQGCWQTMRVLSVLKGNAESVC